MDGEKTFRAPGCKTAMDAAGIKLLPDWPPSSPDMNPIENAFGLCDRHMSKDPRKESFMQFKQRFVNNMKRIGAKHALALLKSLPKRMAAVQKKKGGGSKY